MVSVCGSDSKAAVCVSTLYMAREGLPTEIRAIEEDKTWSEICLKATLDRSFIY